MPDFIIIDRCDKYWFVVGSSNQFATLSEALKFADAIKAKHGGIIANITGRKGHDVQQ